MNTFSLNVDAYSFEFATITKFRPVVTCNDAGCSGSGPSLPTPAAGNCRVPMPRCRLSWKRVSPSCIARTTSASLLSWACACGPSDVLLHDAVCTSWIFVAECSGFAFFVNHLDPQASLIADVFSISFLDSHNLARKLLMQGQVSWHSTHSLLVSGLNHWQEINWFIGFAWEPTEHVIFPLTSNMTMEAPRPLRTGARAALLLALMATGFQAGLAQAPAQNSSSSNGT